MAGGGDVYISFGGDTAGLESALAVAKAEVQSLQREMSNLGREMQRTGASADSELGQSIRSVAEDLIVARAHTKDLSGELSGLKKEGEGAGGFLGNFGNGITQALNGLGEFKAGLGEVVELVAAAFAIEKIAEFVEHMTELGRETTKAAMVLGVPGEQIAGLGLIAEASGINLNTLEMSFSRLSKNVIDQSDGAKRALSALGLSFKDLAGKDANEQFAILADKFSSIKDGAEKDAIGMELFGRAFYNLLPALNEGSAGLSHWEEVAEETGAKLDDTTRAAMKETEEQIIRLGSALKGDGIAIFKEFQPVINGVVKFMADLAIEFSQSIKEGGILKDTLDLLKETFQIVEHVIVDLVRIFQAFWITGSGAIDDIIISFQSVGEVVGDVFSTLGSGTGKFFEGLIAAAKAALKVVGQEFIDLGDIIKNALSGNLTGAKAAWQRMSADALEAGQHIKDALAESVSGFDFGKAVAANDAGNERLEQRNKQTADSLKALNQHLAEEIDAIWGKTEEKVKDSEPKKDAHMPPAGKDSSKEAHEKAMMEIAALNEELRAEEDAGTQKAKLLDDELSHKRISVQKWLAESKAALSQEADDIRATYAKELEVANLTAAEKQKIRFAEADALRKIQDQMVADDRKAADEIEKHWQQVADKIGSTVGGAFKDMIIHSQSFRQVEAKLLDQIGESLIDWAIKGAEQWAVQELVKTSAAQAGAAARTGITAGEVAASESITLPGIIKSIAASASEAFAGVVGFFSPVMGPAAVGPAAATSAAVMSTALGGIYDSGSYSVPNDMIAAVHQGEVIIPSRGGMADEFRSIMSNGGFSSKGGNTTTHNHTWNIMGGNSNPRDIAREVARQWTANPSLRPAY